MKKIAYQTPVIKTLTMECLMQSASDGVSAPDQGIGYGGVDETGDKDPDAKAFDNRSVWDD